jgi:hypothetical protein
MVESVEELENHRAGKIMFIEVTQLAISATDIRTQLLDGLSARYLMPIEVANYINKHQLYHNTGDYNKDRDYEIANIIDLERHAVLSG